MNDEFDKLAAALKATPAPPSKAARELALSMALDAFDQHEANKRNAGSAENLQTARQGNQNPARHNPVSPDKAGFLTGVLTMMKSLSPARILAATTSVAALTVAVIAVGPTWRDGPPQGPVVVPAAKERTQAPVGETPAAPAHINAPPQTVAPDEPVQNQALVEPATPQPVVPEAAKPDATAEAPASEALSDSYSAEMAPAELQAAPPAGAPATRRMAAPLAAGDNAYGSQPMANTSVTEEWEIAAQLSPGTEEFANADPNPLKVTAQEPVSTFSIDVDTASYAIVRQSLMNGQLPPRDAVRIEEMVNYFPYAYAGPQADGAPFRADVTVMPTPWNSGTRLVRIGLQGEKPALENRPALNLVFLVDTSGSMDEPNKLPLLQQALRLTLPQLTDRDQVAIVAYAGSAGVVLEPTKATDEKAILGALNRLQAGGSTAGAEGLELSYEVAARMAGEGEVSRILLATDGDFNVGLSDTKSLTDFVAEKRRQGTYLSVLGFGRGNLDDATMQALAQNGNGLAAYIDTAQEARKVLVDQLSGALFPLADDVKIQVEWNPAEVAEYRLIGYETRALKREDFNNDKVDAGEIGAGHQVTALYEITAPDSNARLTDALRYATEAPRDGAAGELGFLRMRYKQPGATGSELMETPITQTSAEPDDDARFAAAVAGFGQLLTGATYLGDWGWDDAIKLAEGARGRDPFGYRIEAVNLMRLASSMKN